MAAIYLIRHGQASFGNADYDQLSTVGIKQSQILGEHWQSKSIPCRAYSGDLLRHGQTLEHFMESFPNEKIPVVLHSGFNEFDHVDILTCYNTRWHNFNEMSADFIQSKEPNKFFQKEFSMALNRWMSGEFDHEYQESWSQFQTRCMRALQDIIQKELANRRQINSSNTKASKNILVFTSGGTIAAIIQNILQLNDQQVLKINQQTRNTSVSKLLFSKNNLSVDYFNNYSHLALAGKNLVTYR